MNVASFFAGIGGFDLGFEKAGCRIVFHCEIDPHCQLILKRHWPKVPLHADISTLKAADIPCAEVWTAGWPCQDLSSANVQRSGLHGKRSGLFFQFMGLVRENRPKWIVLENVPGLLSANNGTAFESVIDEIEEVGYLGGWMSCNTLQFGLPQDRERIIIIGSLGTDGAYQVLTHCCQLQRNTPAGRQERTNSTAGASRSPGTNNPVVVQRRGGFGYTKGSHICPTLRAQTGRHQGGHSDRPILCGTELNLERVRETNGVSSRLDGRRGRLIGNAIAVPIAEWFARLILLAESGNLKLQGANTGFNLTQSL